MIRRLAADRLTIDETEFLVYTTDWVDTPKAIDRSPFAIVNGRGRRQGRDLTPMISSRRAGMFKGASQIIRLPPRR
jgi:hypothetical protein